MQIPHTIMWVDGLTFYCFHSQASDNESAPVAKLRRKKAHTSKKKRAPVSAWVRGVIPNW